MDYRRRQIYEDAQKKLCLGLITLGALAGGSLSFIAGGLGIGGIMLGGLLGGLLFCMIQWAAVRRQQVILPYDGLDERHQANHHVPTQTPEARLRGMQDHLMIEAMHVRPKPR
jgi:hypothetical protein